MSYIVKNCRWVTMKEQSRNTSKNTIITYKGESHCLSEWAEILKIKPSTIYSRLHLGWSTEKTFETPIIERKKRMENNELQAKILRLEQERDELQDKHSKMIHKYNNLYEKYRAKEILEPDLKNEIKRLDALSIKYSQALEEILESAKFAQCLPCGSGNLEDCLNCNDDTTNNGQFCMEKRIHEIKTKCVEVLR